MINCKTAHLLSFLLALALCWTLVLPGSVRASGIEITEPTETAEATDPTYNTLKKGTILTFGTYPQDGEADPLEWVVMDCEEGVATLTTRYAIASAPYNSRKAEVTWEDSEIRQWLNSDFYDTAFSEEDKALILESYLHNRDNPQYPVDGGESTFDYVYLMSYDEVMSGFSSNRSRTLRPTTHAKDQNIDLSQKDETCWWFLRTPGDSQKAVMYVNSDGSVVNSGTQVNAKKGGIRPTIHILVP